MDNEDAVGWHWDKDYSAEANGVNVHPHIGTVTYLCDNGAPTVFLEKCVGSPYVGESIAGKVSFHTTFSIVFKIPVSVKLR